MAVVSRVATLLFDGVTGSRTWTATADQQDRAAGASWTITIIQSTTGATPPGAANTLTFNIYRTDGALQQSFPLTPGSASQQVTFTPTTAGTFLLDIRATRTDLGTYDYETDGAPSTAPAGFTADIVDRGWVRSTTTATQTLNATNYAYPDAISSTVTLGAVPAVARNLTVTLGPASATASASTASTVVALGNADNRFPVASTAYSTTLSFANESLTGQPWTTAAATQDDATVDPRLTVTHYMQLDSVTWGTPPNGVTDSTHNVTSRLTSQEGDIAHRLSNAAGVGQNGVTFRRKISNAANAAQVGYDDTGLVSTTQGGQTGWSPSFGAWASQLSGGSWTSLLTITAPAAAVGLEAGGSATFTLLASDSRMGVLVSAGPTIATEGRHLQPGDGIKVAVSVYNRDTRTRLAPDSAPILTLLRYHRVNGWEYLASNGTTWTAWGAGVADGIVTVVEADLLSFTATFGTTSGWGATDLVAVQVSFRVNGTPYGTYVTREMTDIKNSHDQYTFDGAGFVGFPTH